MPRIIFKCPYIKPRAKSAAAHRERYVRYVATRDGAEVFTPEERRENYVSYIAQRPRAERLGAHGLFNGTGDTLELSKIAEEVANHPGNVWLPIISLRREDVARLGYDSAGQWQALLSAYATEIAEAMHIPWNQFRWYASFHNEGTHPHVHMVCYSADGRSGFLDKGGIARVKSGLAKNIFRQELTEIYQQQTKRRDELVRKSGKVLKELIQQMCSGTLENPCIEQLTSELALRLKSTSGKKQYGYLKAPLKAIVDEIVDELAKDSRVAAAYDLWYQLREEVLRTYKNDLPQCLPLSQQAEFKRIKNLVIEEAARLGEQPAFPQPIFIHDAVRTPTQKQSSSPSSPPVARSVTRLLHHMGRIFEDQPLPQAKGITLVDRKLRQKIREKKMAHGHKGDDHEQAM